jgi:hypothetical protein
MMNRPEANAVYAGGGGGLISLPSDSSNSRWSLARA